jgi:hypothetical protein
MPSPTAVTWSDIMGAFRDSGIDTAQIVCWSADYACFDLDWVRGAMSEEFHAQLDNYGVADYHPGKNKCTQFAIWAWGFANFKNAISTPPDGDPSAFGMCVYKKDSGEGHAINALVTRDEGVLTPWFYEPQTQQILYADSFSRFEKASMKLIFP